MDVNKFLEGLSWEPVSDFDNKLSYNQRLHRIRHSSSHLMAYALLELKKEVHFATGPATERGFFYDFRAEEKLLEEDLAKIEAKMEEIVAANYPFEYAKINRADAYPLFEALGQPLKKEVLDKIPDEEVTLYRVGEFVDLCAGPHVAGSRQCNAFKLLNISAAHWKDEKFPSLIRLSGTAWENKKKLRLYMEFLEEVKKRDHRTLGPQLELFSFHPWAASAMWHPKGVVFRKIFEDFWRDTIFDQEKYVEITNPILYRKDLFETSGHWQHFHDDMFVINKGEEVDFVLKPMNCPDTMLFFGSKMRSYRELPLRVAEGQMLHRNEPAGALHGIMRARNFNQDDAHIFLAPEHLEAEIKDLLEMIHKVYSVFGLSYRIALSTRPEKYMGDLELWDQAESTLKEVLAKDGKEFTIDEGEGAFYGPKIDVTINDSLGRAWQCGTIQLDFQLPIRFDLKYVHSSGEQERPIVIHRAIFGSFERFMGIIIEHFGGAFPTWLSPVQAAVLTISDQQNEYALALKEQLKQKGFRVVADISNETLNYKIRSAETSKIPYILVVGDREVESGMVNVRRYGGGRLGNLSIEDLIGKLKEVSVSREMDVKIKDFSTSLNEVSADVETEEMPY